MLVLLAIVVMVLVLLPGTLVLALWRAGHV